MITLSDLLARRELGLRLLSGPDDPSAVRIETAEVCDLPDPRPWLDSGAMLLTTGVAIGPGAHVQRLLVERAFEARAAAIGFAVGLAHAAVPRGIREACEQLGVPLVAVPAATPFRLLVAAVAQQATPHELQVAQRTLSIQNHLMEALSAPDPEAEVLRRLGSLLTGTALIADEAGTVTGAPDSALPDELWGPLRGGKGVGLHHVRGQRYVTAPISDRVGTRRWLVVVGAGAALPDHLARQALLSAERLVRLIDRARPPRPVEARTVRAELCEELLGWRTPTGGRRHVAQRASALGLSIDAGLQVAAVRAQRTPAAGDGEPGRTGGREAGPQVLGRVRAELEAWLTSDDVPFLLTTRDLDLVLIGPVPLGDALEPALHDLASAAGPLDAGVGRATASVEQLPRSHQDARFALQQLANAAGDGRSRLLRHEQLDLVTALVCDADPRLYAPRRQAVIDALGGPPLEDTLRAFLEHRLDVTATAQALHLHPNSLRYRLSRIEERLGRSLRDPGTIAMLHVAFRFGWAFRE
ncbi:helix-turn-helix domain-containing protein [Patulibacter defluvii]|uniref:helix-turn-helix domain-containing protein n=1 Tax=Patulibacter defluvii TaxID=3095358 RepID=UPI002A763BBD|nr:helix-turn-helix domain-containing protein [Patulibacter sp. DM4]